MSASGSSSSSAGDSERAQSPPIHKRKRDEPPAEDAGSSDSDDSDDEDTPDVPALSHAEKRRQKRKEKQQAKDDSESALKKRKGADGAVITTTTASGASGKRQNSVWVGNMTFKTTPEALKEFFTANGAGEITRVHMPMKAPAGPGLKPENRGFAYVDFASADGKIAAIALSEQLLVGRRLLIKDGGDFTGRPAVPGAPVAGDGSEPSKSGTGLTKTAQKILRAQKQPPAATLFLGNLGFETTEKSIRELFDAHREIKKKTSKDDADAGDDESKEKPKEQWIRRVRLGTFEDSGLCKGFAFVDFTTTEHATSALINPRNHTLDGRKLVVEYASADAVRRGAPKPKRVEGEAPRRGGGAYRGGSRGGARSAGPRGIRLAERESRAAEPDYSEPSIPTTVQSEGEPVAAPDGKRSFGGSRPERREKGPRVRPKPGAALALAKRESAAIVPMQGQKITF